jgi:phage baseplate assembly protein W
MAITISNLSSKSDTKSYIFADIHLDLEESKRSTNSRNGDVVAGNDIIVDKDQEAIKNSIRNILLQRRFLNPSFGANIKSYIGQPLTEMGAYSLGNIIDRNLNLFEPRIKVEKILVAPDYDKFEYAIVIIYTFRNFKSDVIVLNAGFSVGRGDFYFIK